MNELSQNSESQLVTARNALRESDLRFRTLADAFPHMVWSTLPDGYHDYYNARWYEFTGVPAGSTDGEAWNGMFHPDDQERAWGLWRHSLRTGEPYEIEYRLRHHSGEYRWVLGRAMPMRNSEGTIIRWMGTCTDIHEQKRQANQNEILSRELSHRIKNIFAVIAGLIGLSARQQPEHRDFARTLQERIAALGRAHEFVRPHSDQSQPGDLPDSLKGIFREVLAPYLALQDGRISIEGIDVTVDDRGATPIALLIHELATNAAKYGALSTGVGRVDITLAEQGGEISIDWRESGGPAITGEPVRQGFGTRLTELSIVNQLGGSIEREWRPEGLWARMTVGRERLARSP
ncbi:sensor histidine kinase [Sphingomonas xanthus]|uniref:sensor histidine kinase n=1 Tax=Sphingomonas xanthus TaxID=2594473 RepID=UPI003CCC8313